MEYIDLSRATNDKQLDREAIVDESDQACFMVQGIDSLEVKSDTHLDDNASSSCDENAMNAHALNEEFFMFYEKLLSKYKALKFKSINNMCANVNVD